MRKNSWIIFFAMKLRAKPTTWTTSCTLRLSMPPSQKHLSTGPLALRRNSTFSSSKREKSVSTNRASPPAWKKTKIALLVHTVSKTALSMMIFSLFLHLRRALSCGGGSLHGCSKKRIDGSGGFLPIKKLLEHLLHDGKFERNHERGQHHAHCACRCRRRRGICQRVPWNCGGNPCSAP